MKLIEFDEHFSFKIAIKYYQYLPVIYIIIFIRMILGYDEILINIYLLSNFLFAPKHSDFHTLSRMYLPQEMLSVKIFYASRIQWIYKLAICNITESTSTLGK